MGPAFGRYPAAMAPARPAASVAATLVARGLHAAVGGTALLHGVDVTVTPGTRLGLVGPNGAGKSTLLRLLAGLERPESGTVALAPPTASVGLLAQEPERRPGETVQCYLERRTGVAPRRRRP